MRLELEVPVCLLLLRSRMYIETQSAVSLYVVCVPSSRSVFCIVILLTDDQASAKMVPGLSQRHMQHLNDTVLVLERIKK